MGEDIELRVSRTEAPLLLKVLDEAATRESEASLAGVNRVRERIARELADGPDSAP